MRTFNQWTLAMMLLGSSALLSCGGVPSEPLDATTGAFVLGNFGTSLNTLPTSNTVPALPITGVTTSSIGLKAVSSCESVTPTTTVVSCNNVIAAAQEQDRGLDLQEPARRQGLAAGRCGGLSRPHGGRRAGQREACQLPDKHGQCHKRRHRRAGRGGPLPGVPEPGRRARMGNPEGGAGVNLPKLHVAGRMGGHPPAPKPPTNPPRCADPQCPLFGVFAGPGALSP